MSDSLVSLKQSLTTRDLTSYLMSQLSTFFPDQHDCDESEAIHFTARTLERVAHCFRHIGIHYYRDGDTPVFNHLHSDQYATFLYFFANTVHREGGDPRLAAKVYYLNKMLHGLDVYYAVDLPPIFLFVHPVGTVIGRARFGDFLAVYQNCTIGGDLDLNYPSLGTGVAMFSGSRVIGRSIIGSNCLIAAGASVIDHVAPDNTVTFGQRPTVQSRPTRHTVIECVFQHAAQL